jgi:hypothetical protein
VKLYSDLSAAEEVRASGLFRQTFLATSSMDFVEYVMLRGRYHNLSGPSKTYQPKTGDTLLIWYIDNYMVHSDQRVKLSRLNGVLI